MPWSRWCSRLADDQHRCVLVERDGAGVASWKTELRDHRAGDSHWRREVSVNMLNSPKKEELVTDDPPSTVCEIRVQIDVRRWRSRWEQLRTRAEGRAPEDEPSLPVVIVRAGLRDCVEHGTDSVAKLGGEAV